VRVKNENELVDSDGEREAAMSTLAERSDNLPTIKYLCAAALVCVVSYFDYSQTAGTDMEALEKITESRVMREATALVLNAVQKNELAQAVDNFGRDFPFCLSGLGIGGEICNGGVALRKPCQGHRTSG